jgi:hypothetical protein
MQGHLIYSIAFLLFFLLGSAASTKAQALYYGPFQHENFSILKWYSDGYVIATKIGLYSYSNAIVNGLSKTKLDNYANSSVSATLSNEKQPLPSQMLMKILFL